MHELGAEFDRHAERLRMHRPDTSADAIPRLEDGDVFALLMQSLRGGESGDAGADDDGGHGLENRE